MSNVQIPNLPVAIALNGTEALEAVQSGTSVQTTVAGIAQYSYAYYPGFYISQLPAASSANSTDIFPVVQGSTGPNTGTTGKMTLAAAALGVGVGANVRAFGATGDGVTDDTAAFVAAAASLPNGGVLLVPAGTYMVSYGTGLFSGTQVRGAGRQATRIKAIAGFPGSGMSEAYSFFYNVNWNAASLAAGDNDISVSGITFDYSWNTANNAMHPLNFRYVTRLLIEDNYFFYGGNSIACRGCEETWVVGNSGYEFRNCAWDFWEGPGTTYVVNNYAETSQTAQMMNFNPEVSPVASSPLYVIGKRLVVQGNVFRCTGAASEPCQIEPLSNRDNGITDVVISGNQFHRSYLVHRGYVDRLIIANNTFNDYPNPNTSVIIVSPANSYTPKAVSIISNVITDPGTNSANLGVIRCEVNSATVTGNVITGTTYTGAPFYQGTALPNQYGNWFEKLGITGRMRQGFVLTNSNDGTNDAQSCIAWEDTDGDPLRMYMTGNFHQFYSTNANGTLRQVWSMQANNDASQWGILIGASFSDQVRISPNTGLTAIGSTSGTALALTKNFNEVTTVNVGTGVRLPTAGANSVTGLRVTVWNAGANTLNVYPMSGGQINALGTNIPDTIASGANKTYVALSNTLYRIET